MAKNAIQSEYYTFFVLLEPHKNINLASKIYDVLIKKMYM